MSYDDARPRFLATTWLSVQGAGMPQRELHSLTFDDTTEDQEASFRTTIPCAAVEVFAVVTRDIQRSGPARIDLEANVG
jgi:hypothetical protein